MKTVLSATLLLSIVEIVLGIDCYNNIDFPGNSQVLDAIKKLQADDDTVSCQSSGSDYCVTSNIWIDTKGKPMKYTYYGCAGYMKIIMGQIISNDTYTTLINLDCGQSQPAGNNDTSVGFSMTYNCCKNQKCDLPQTNQVHWGGGGNGVSGKAFSVGLLGLTAMLFGRLY